MLFRSGNEQQHQQHSTNNAAPTAPAPTAHVTLPLDDQTLAPSRFPQPTASTRASAFKTGMRCVGDTNPSDTEITTTLAALNAQSPQCAVPIARPAPPPLRALPVGPAQPAANQDLRAHAQGADIAGVGDVAAALHAQGRERAQIGRAHV